MFVCFSFDCFPLICMFLTSSRAPFLACLRCFMYLLVPAWAVKGTNKFTPVSGCVCVRLSFTLQRVNIYPNLNIFGFRFLRKIWIS